LTKQKQVMTVWWWS